VKNADAGAENLSPLLADELAFWEDAKLQIL
jgi:hypothetical protein